jgi:hypothetical protein
MQNAWSVAMEEQPVGHLMLSDDVVHLGELRNSGFYNEVLRPQGIGHNAMIALAARDDFRVAFNIAGVSAKALSNPPSGKVLKRSHRTCADRSRSASASQVTARYVTPRLKRWSN